ncbi:S8 family peptidase [Peterkaempfera bronchialis]|uniref:S8 family peptidase n=1 Tax=Peterkaempfera bronchialis TaxID=2126346 RepID=UPI00158C7582|nr:S8 family serine peptidase [Peterkaempfera bronchialis]
MQQVPSRGRTPLLIRCLAVLSLAALLLGGAVPYAGGPGRAYLGYLVVAERVDAAGAALAAREVTAAGGVVVQEYPQIGVVLAYSAARSFAERLRVRPGIAEAGAGRTAPVFTLPGPPADGGGFRAYGRPAGPHDTAPAAVGGQPVGGRVDRLPAADDTPTVPDPRERSAWNLRMIGADAGPGESGAALFSGIGGGPDREREALRRVVVAVLDSGVDDSHPDLREAVDPDRSASCADGRPDPRFGAWRPDPAIAESGHGTHVAGIIGAARDGDGVVGVAPGVRIAAVRLLGPLGQYYPENIVCGLLWAADHGARAINDSYFSDPWKYNCPDNRDQAAVVAAVGRAVRYARERGAVVVASAGNDAQDLGASRTDGRSPNDRTSASPPPVRTLGAECIRLPAELPGVVSVSAVERSGALAGYSNYGGDRIVLAAPGGDPGGGAARAVVSDWPGGRYAALAGTSMAAAHVTGAVALAAAAHPEYGSDRLRAVLTGAARRGRCAPGAGLCADPRYFGAGVVTVVGLSAAPASTTGSR